MGVVVDLQLSHRYTFLSPVTAAFKLTVLPAGGGVARDLHYVILVDSSGSMRGKKIRVARQGARMLIERIPEGNYVTLIAFGVGRGEVEVLAEGARVPEERDRLLRAVEKLRAEDGTPLYHALLTAERIARAVDRPGFIVLLSDGIPTDVTDLEAYRKLDIPEGYKAVLVGIGTDYNHELFTLLADITGGDFYHISEKEVDKLPEIMESFAVEEAAARYVEVEITSPLGEVKVLNYQSPKISIPALDGPLVVMGEVQVPKLYKGKVLEARVSYMDPERDERVEVTREAHVEPAEDRETFLNGINRQLLDEYNYYHYMAKAREALLRGNLEEATKKIATAEQLAEKTRRIHLIEETRRIAAELEQTKKLTGPSLQDATRKLLSEATRRLRKPD